MSEIQKKHGRRRAPIVAVGHLPSVADVEPELEWVFTMAEGEMGDCSNYESTVRADCTVATAEDRIEAARKHSKILACLRTMTSSDAGVLQAAYEPGGWPLRLREELGTVTGIVVRLACGEIGLPDDRHAQKAMERRIAKQLDDACQTHGFAPIQRLRVRAQELLNKAHHAYAEIQGKETRQMQEKRDVLSPTKNHVAPTATEGLPVRGFYKIAELARALGTTRWRIGQMLAQAGVELYVPGKVALVPLSELEAKAKPLWEGIKAAEKLRQVVRATATDARLVPSRLGGDGRKPRQARE
jgi:hypothetical protein